jgi:2-polyprenyl-6-methoxyphenol hydroxylase-like FAD-dependent oxidoreductase
MKTDADALVIGAGPAGAASAILLAQAGWQVILVEQCLYPRQKVCGECLTAGSLAQLDELGVGAAVRDRAGPELQQVGWMQGSSTLTAAMPPCTDGPYRYGRALGRDQLDSMLADRAAAVGVTRIQPAKVRSVRGLPGDFVCEIEPLDAIHSTAGPVARIPIVRRVPVVIDAHGSWEAGPWEPRVAAARSPRVGSDLFGFKASFRDARLAPGLLPVLAFPGGYGGMVIAEGGRLTFAGCIRRDTLGLWRSRTSESSAGVAFEHSLRHTCNAVTAHLDGASRVGSWMSVGPLRPGIRGADPDGPFRVGNAAAETHPLIGEGINMALQSARFLTNRLIETSPHSLDARGSRKIQREVTKLWHKAFARRMHLAALYAQVAMHPTLALPFTALLRCYPPVLTRAAQLAGKARRPFDQSPAVEVRHEHA